MFFSVGGGDGTRPTLFELVAAEGLLPGLKDAVVYSLGVFEHRRPVLRRIVDRQHETFAVLAWWIERQSLRDNGASFAETLYGLKRCNADGGELSQTQKKACLLALVAAPYVQAKLEAWHERMRARRRPVFGLEEVDLSGGANGTETSTSQDGANAWEELVLKMYPKLRSFHEGLKFLYQFTYLMGLTDYSSPLLHLLQVKLMRASGVDLLKNEKELRARRDKEIQVAKSHRNLLLRKLHEWPLRVSHAMADNLQYTLMACVFGFKLLEWWFTTVEEKMKAQKMLPVPPPPPVVEPAPDGVGLPQDASLCPVCRRPRVNPALAEPSGYSYCYTCLFNYVAEKGCCPVSRVRMTTDKVRRLYPAS